MENDTLTIEGTVTTKIFDKNPPFYIFLIDGSKKLKGCVHIGGFNIGMKIKCLCILQNDLKYGPTYVIKYVEQILDKKPNSIKKILTQIPGIGEKKADLLLKDFINNDYDDILKELSDLDFVSKKLKNKNDINNVVSKCKEMIINKDESDINFFLYSLPGMTDSMIDKIKSVYTGDVKNIIMTNPYRLCDKSIDKYKIKGINFDIADKIAIYLGFKQNSDIRIKSAINHILENDVNKGHCIIEKNKLIKDVIKLIHLSFDKISNFIDHTDAFCKQKDESKNDIICYNSIYKAESKSCSIITNFMFFEYEKKIDDNFIDKYIKIFEIEHEIIFNDEQIKAIYMAFSNKILIITGGPGRGKTMIQKAICYVLNQFSIINNQIDHVIITAYTGLATKNLSKAIGRNYSNLRIHDKTLTKFISLLDSDNGMKEAKEYKNVSFFIIDEVSVIDIHRFYDTVEFISHICPHATIIMIGDVDQLPSIGPGSVLKDVINSNILPCLKLDKMCRMKDNSCIIPIANMINNKQCPEFSLNEPFNELNDVYFYECDNDDLINIKIIDLIENIPSLTSHIKSDIKILTSQNKTLCGAINLNNILQKNFNSNSKDVNKPHFHVGEYTFFEGDYVMATKNNYNGGDLPLYCNGDIGVITKIIIDKKIINNRVNIFADINVFFEHKLKPNSKLEPKFKHIDDLNDVNDDLNDVNDDVNDVDHDLVFSNKNDDSSYDISHLVLAYALTIHKSQGCEYPVVIIPISPSLTFLNKTLLYTAVTRTKKLLFFVGKFDVFIRSIKKDFIDRKTNLKHYLKNNPITN